MYVRISTSNTTLQKCKPLPQPHRKPHCNKNLKCFQSNHLVYTKNMFIQFLWDQNSAGWAKCCINQSPQGFMRTWEKTPWTPLFSNFITLMLRYCSYILKTVSYKITVSYLILFKNQTTIIIYSVVLRTFSKKSLCSLFVSSYIFMDF